ncbi:MAG: caspase family protein [Bacteroidota bacterium]
MPPESEEKDRSIKHDPPSGQTQAPHPVGDYYLFVIAIDEYEKSPNQPTLQSLNNPVLDASRVVDVLITEYTFFKPEKGVNLSAPTAQSDRYQSNQIPVIEYDDIKTKCLYNENATVGKIEEHLDKLIKEVKENDCVLIYFAGHGVVKNTTGYLIPFEGREGKATSWIRIDFITDYFKERKKSRHLLLILDSCYSGLAFLGDKRDEGGNYSRDVLTSSGEKQKASDGKAGKGSPFANAFYEYMRENTEPVSVVRFSKLQSKFDKIIKEEYSGSKQKIAYKQLPMDSGSGRFPFHLREKDRPKGRHLAATLIQHLDFNNQKGQLDDHLFMSGEDDVFIFFSIISCSNTQTFLRKVLMHRLKALNDKLSFSREPHFVKVRLKLMDSGDLQTNIWKLLSKQFKIRDTIVNVQEQLVDHILDLLKENNAETRVIRPVMITLEYEGTANFLEQLLGFCQSFVNLFFEKKRRLATYEKLGKLFIFLADTRGVGKLFKDRSDIANIIGDYPRIVVNEQLSDINIGHVRGWKMEAQKVIKAQLITKLADDYFFPPGTKPYPLFDFIGELNDYCYQDKDDLLQTFIDFEK